MHSPVSLHERSMVAWHDRHAGKHWGLFPAVLLFWSANTRFYGIWLTPAFLERPGLRVWAQSGQGSDCLESCDGTRHPHQEALDANQLHEITARKRIPERSSYCHCGLDFSWGWQQESLSSAEWGARQVTSVSVIAKAGDVPEKMCRGVCRQSLSLAVCACPGECHTRLTPRQTACRATGSEEPQQRGKTGKEESNKCQNWCKGRQRESIVMREEKQPFKLV